MSKYFEILFNVPIDQSFFYLQDEKCEAKKGKRAVCPFGRREETGFIISEKNEEDFLKETAGKIPAEKLKKIKRVIDKDAIFSSKEIELAKWVSDYYFCTHGEALSAMIPSGRRVPSVSSISVDDLNEAILPNSTYELSSEQNDALHKIVEEPASDNKTQLYYLFGITGSGKTEVFLKAAQHILNSGKSVIYLVPEISLTHQTQEAIEKRFGSIAATFHSGMSGQERFAKWLQIRKGEVRIVIGPRSAVFAPVIDLGLIIIDEEHDGSYKSGNTPRYHARQIAIKRCTLSKAKLVMGSATPSVEAWKLMNDGIIQRLLLTRRLSGGQMPEIKPISILSTSSGCLTNELKQEIRKTAQEGKQTILFLNRRGFAYYYCCPSCGYELKCKHCSVSLTYHKITNKAVCHYCGYKTVPPPACPSCGSLVAGFMGFGTEKIEEEVTQTFPDLHVLRVDADSVSKKGDLEEKLKMFRLGIYDILLGTQMVAKGLNFPNVRLVGIIFADTGLSMPDFRSYERVFSLIVQVAGRAGRFFSGGKVLVQTLRPNDTLILKACALDVKGFYEEELKQRLLMNFPPFSRLIRLLVRSKDAAYADEAITQLNNTAKSIMPHLARPGCEILGPADCPIELIAGNHRRHILLRGRNMSILHGAAHSIIDTYAKHKNPKVYLEIDVDPVNVL